MHRAGLSSWVPSSWSMVQRIGLVETSDYFGEDDLHKAGIPLIYSLQSWIFCDLNVCKNLFVPENFTPGGICLSMLF